MAAIVGSVVSGGGGTPTFSALCLSQSPSAPATSQSSPEYCVYTYPSSSVSPSYYASSSSPSSSVCVPPFSSRYSASSVWRAPPSTSSNCSSSPVFGASVCGAASSYSCSSSASSSSSASAASGFSNRVLRGSQFFMGVGGKRLGVAIRALRRSGVHQMVQEEQQREQGKQVGGGAWSLAKARAVWKQEVLWAESPVAEVERAAESLFHLALDVSDNPELVAGHTKAGQFVQVKVGNTKPAFLAIASPPSLARKGRLEFLIKDPGLEGSTAGILCSLAKGDRVELSQVLGSGFKVERLEPADQYGTVLLFATGSGISPIRSLIEAGFGADKRPDVRLYYGARNLKRMAYQDRFKDWEAAGIQVVPVLSQPGEDWGGAQGYVQAFFSKNMGIAKAAQTGALLCGHKEMAQDVTGLLVSEGVSKENILLNF